MVLQFAVGFGAVKGNGIYITTCVVIGLSIVALIVDFFHCKHRWEAGLKAEFPKAIPVTSI